jgi:heme oxygenase (mycobilin-producing)
VQITLFEVARADDERFLARRPDGGVLFRALREDVAFRFAAVTDAPVASDFPARAGEYEVAHADGAPDGREGVTLINPFEIPAGADEAFLAGWHAIRETLSAQRGYLGTRLHRSDAAEHRFVNVARWSSPLMFARALRTVEAGIPFASHPALYLVV